MDQLGDNITDLFYKMFKARVVSLNMSAKNNSQQVYAMGNYTAAGNVAYGTEYSLEINMEEVAANFMTEDYQAHTVYYAARHGLLEPLVKGCAAIQSMRVNKDIDRSVYRTSLELIVFDMDKFSENAKNFSWNIFSKEFDETLENKLSE